MRYGYEEVHAYRIHCSGCYGEHIVFSAGPPTSLPEGWVEKSGRYDGDRYYCPECTDKAKLDD